MLEVSCSIVSFTPLPSLICGVILSSRADLLALDRLERVHRAVRRAGVRELARDERHFLADLDLGFLVVERHDLRRRDDVRVGVAARARRPPPPSSAAVARSCRPRA